MRVISISVDGIYQAGQRGLFDWLASQDAEIICLQDLRAKAYEVEDTPEFQLDGYYSYYFDSPDEHCNGVAIYTRHAPKAIMFGFGLSSGEDMNGRYIQADFDRLSVVSLLTPASITDEASQEAKMDFLNGLQNHLLKISRKRRDYIICAHLNIAHKTIDVENSDTHTESPGFLPEERQWLDQLYSEINYSDAFRNANADNDEFSWWPSGEIGQGDGWRTDTQIVSRSLSSFVDYAVLYTAKTFSSHTPVIVDYDLHDH
jgi:exodeoxyribonuclease III